MSMQQSVNDLPELAEKVMTDLKILLCYNSKDVVKTGDIYDLLNLKMCLENLQSAIERF